jgi:amino acid transporter
MNDEVPEKEPLMLNNYQRAYAMTGLCTVLSILITGIFYWLLNFSVLVLVLIMTFECFFLIIFFPKYKKYLDKVDREKGIERPKWKSWLDD